jgi:thioredoxin 1
MLELNENNFRKEVLESAKPALVAFWRPGCGACSSLSPLLEAVEAEIKDKAKIGRVNIFENPEISERYKIPAVPTIIIFNGGEPKEKAVGLRPKNALINKINHLIK